MASAVVARSVTTVLTSPGLRAARFAAASWWRRARKASAVVHYFHDAADPYSHLTAQLLPGLGARYRISLRRHEVPPPDAEAAPDRKRLGSWSARDAAMLAHVYGLVEPACPADANGIDAAALRAGAAARRRLGHYLGATFYFEGAWYWGLDRLHYLEDRLASQGLDSTPGAANLAPLRDVTLLGPAGAARGRVVDMFLSLRSPYSYIALPRVQALARHYGAELRLRFVLPMVMRGLKVPAAKRVYITLDTKREAERLGLPFGTIVDPVGVGVERGLAVLHHAIRQGRGEAFAMSFLQGAFSGGIDAASPRGLARMAARAGINAQSLRQALDDPGWRDVADANRAELLAAGLWGVPCFRVDGGDAVWGQDRLWVIEDRLRALAA